jgi:protein phosphatase 1L
LALQNVACFKSSSADSGKGTIKSSNYKVAHGFHLVEGKSGHDMEDYHVAEYRKKKDHVLGLFAIFDGHLGDRVPSYLRDNLFNHILDEVSLLHQANFVFLSILLCILRFLEDYNFVCYS